MRRTFRNFQIVDVNQSFGNHLQPKNIKSYKRKLHTSIESNFVKSIDNHAAAAAR